MKKLFRFIPFPVMILGSFLSIFMSLAIPPSQVEAIVCTGTQQAIRESRLVYGMAAGAPTAVSFPQGYATCITPSGDANACNPDTEVPVSESGGTVCKQKANNREITIQCIAPFQGVPIVVNGEEHCGSAPLPFVDDDITCTPPQVALRPPGNIAIGAVHGFGSARCVTSAQQEIDNAPPPGDPANPDGPGDLGDPNAPEGGEEVESSCNIEGVGWIICPVMLFMGETMDRAFGFLADNFLVVQPALTSDPGVAVSWGYLRNIANGIFIILFMIVIFSQVSNMGISNYGIKKLLPKILVTAVLINASLIICQIAVDLSNIAGFIAHGMFDGVQGRMASWAEADGQDVATEAAEGGWVVALVGGVLIATVAVIYFVAPILGAVLAAGLVAIVVVVFILIARKALILLLTVISPIAFAAILLPNTQKLFDKWKSIFIGLLLVFPMIGLLYGASSLAATIVQGAGAAGGEVADEDGVDAFLLQITALAIMTLPLFATWPLLKGSLDATGKIGAKINELGSKGISKGREAGDQAHQRKLARMANNNSGNKFIRGTRRIAGALGTKSNVGFNPRRPFDRFADQKRRYAAAGAAAQKEEVEQLNDQWDRNPKINVGQRAVDLANKGKGNSTEFQAAVARLAGKGDHAAVREARMALEGVTLEGQTLADGRENPNFGLARRDANGQIIKSRNMSVEESSLFENALGSNYSAMKSKDPRITNGFTREVRDANDNIVRDGNGRAMLDDFNFGALKQVDMHNMKDEVIQAGMNSGGQSGNSFRRQLKTAMEDPRQREFFTENIQNRVDSRIPSTARPSAPGTGGGQGGSGPQGGPAGPSGGSGSSPGPSGPRGGAPGSSGGGGGSRPSSGGSSSPGSQYNDPSGAPFNTQTRDLSFAEGFNSQTPSGVYVPDSFSRPSEPASVPTPPPELNNFINESFTQQPSGLLLENEFVAERQQAQSTTTPASPTHVPTPESYINQSNPMMPAPPPRPQPSNRRTSQSSNPDKHANWQDRFN